MKTKETSVCRKCGGNGKPSKGYMNFHNIRRNDEREFETKLLDCIKCESCGHSWIPETSPKQIYITVVTSGLTMLANKVARVLQPNEDIFDACSELANDIAKENGLEWSNVLVQYFNHYNDEYPAMSFKVPSKPKSTREQAIAWWNNLPSNSSTISKQHYYDKYFVNGNKFTSAQNYSQLTGREIEEIWRKENPIAALPDEMINTDFDGIEEEHSLPSINESLTKLGIDYNQTAKATNSKVFKQFDESLFRAYISKFSDEDKIWALRALVKTMPESNLKKHVNSWFE